MPPWPGVPLLPDLPLGGLVSYRRPLSFHLRVVDGVTYAVAGKLGGTDSRGGYPAKRRHSDEGSDCPGNLGLARHTATDKAKFIVR
jgi:hypothetical protein